MPDHYADTLARSPPDAPRLPRASAPSPHASRSSLESAVEVLVLLEPAAAAFEREAALALERAPTGA
jgi:hypothetical protein